jgi:uncharacterized protein involved in exopolysaccharide biosynthesis/Mrp family chromosome partitioning ATPase
MDRLTTGQWLSAPDRQNPVDREFIGLSDITSFLRIHARSIAGWVGIGILGAGFYIATTDRIYTASTQILIEPRLPQLLQQQAAEVNLSLDTAQVESQIAVMKSEKIAMMVINELKLLDDAKFNRPQSLSLAGRIGKLMAFAGEALGFGAAESAADAPERSQLPPPGVADDAAKIADFERNRRTIWTFQNGLDVRRLGVSYAIEISFSSPDAEMAAKIANATANALVREQLETKAAAAREGGTWLEKRLGELRTQMNTATQIAQEFRARHDYGIARQADGTAASEETANNWDAGTESEGPTLEELEVTADTYRKMYESFLQAYTSSVSQQSYPVADARVITPASRPLSASHPRRKLVMAFGGLFGIIAGVGIAFVNHSLNRTVRSARQVREEFGLDCIGELPPGGHFHEEVTKSPHSGFSERLRRTMTAISLADTSHPVRLLGITAAFPGDGKSSCASNLATLYSMHGFKTLLIDADIVNSVVTERLSPPPDGLDKPVTLTGEITKQIVPTVGGWFDLLPITASRSRDLLSVKNMQMLLPKLKNYDMVVVDLPPLAAGSEKLAVSSLFDGVVVAAAWGKTPSESLSELVRVLHSLKAPLIGVLLTQVRILSSRPSREGPFWTHRLRFIPKTWVTLLARRGFGVVRAYMSHHRKYPRS